MNLISCDHCGVVLDANKLAFPVTLEKDDGSIDERYAEWNSLSRIWEAFTLCPVCDGHIHHPHHAS